MSKRISRRQVLRGAGTVAIGLPLGVLALDSHAEPAGVPNYVSLFFSNGLPRKYADEGFDGYVLGPLATFASKMAMLHRMELRSGSGASLHYRGSSRFGVGITPDSESSAAGPSLDNEIHEQHGGATKLLNVNMHTHVTGGNPATRWFHSWRGVNQPNDELLRPLDIFDYLFGSFMPKGGGGPTPEELKNLRYRQSVLDSVVEQYRELKGETSGYSAAVRSKLNDHFELVRALEQQALDMDDLELTCDEPPPEPPDLEPSQACTPELCPSDDASYYGEGGANWNEVWELISQLYAMGLRCGITRFGTAGCTGGGDRYPIPELSAVGVTESPHILAHDWSQSNENGFDHCVEWLMQKLAYFLAQLDDPTWMGPSGGTVLDDTIVLIGTEMGTDGDGQHNADSMTYFVAGGTGCINPGVYDLSGRADVDLYSTLSQLFGIGEQFGNAADYSGPVEEILV